MSKEITVQQIINRIKNHPDISWKDSSVDILNTGEADALVKGIATSFTASLDVLKRSVVTGKNLIITQQPAFYQEDHSPSGVGSNPVELLLKNDPTYLFKKDFIDKHKLVIWRFYDNWNSRKEDGQLLGLAKSLGWEKYHIHNFNSGEKTYDKKNKYFLLPECTLSNMVIQIQNKLNIKGIRVIGDPKTKIKKAAILHGMLQFIDLQDIIQSEPDVDLIIIAEAIEWESPEYFRDLLTWGKKKGMIIIGREASEDPGYGEVASWLKTFISDVPIAWIPANEPFWIP